jgi:metal-sulfur cluster biosynthetic enzyme
MPMLVTELGMVTEVKPLQPSKASTLMLVTELGMVTEVKPLQPEKAQLPMLVTPCPMVRVSMLLR